MSTRLIPAKTLPPRASYTQLSSSQRCAFQYWLKYIVGIERVGKAQGLLRGSILHNALDAYLFSGRASHQIVFDVIDQELQALVDDGTSAELIDTVGEEAKLVMEHYLPWADANDDFEVWFPPGATQTEVEGEIDVLLPDGTTHPLVYKIDALIKRSDGHLVMMEHKFRKNLDSNGLEHDLQILLYQTAWNIQNPDNPITGALYNIVAAKPRKKDGIIAVREFFYRGPDEERVGLRMAGAMIQTNKLRLEQNLWPMNPGRECNWFCDFVGLCLAARTGAKVSELVDGVNYRTRDINATHRKHVLDDEVSDE